jgi:uncharacterized protein
MKRLLKRPPKATTHSAPSPLSPAPLYAVRRSAIQGRGVFARTALKKGTRILEYAGERITNAEASRRYDDESMRRHHTFLFAISSRTCIDGASEGNDARFINHSCSPNCEALQVGRRIFIYSKRAIPEGEELAYDYAYEVDPPDAAMYPCHCGTPKCRGTMVKTRKRK